MKQNHKISLSCIIRSAIASCLLWTGLSAYAQTTLKAHGAVMLKGVIEKNLAEITSKSGVQLELVSNGSDNGLLDLVENRADIALTSAPIDVLAKELNAKKADTINPAQLTSLKLGAMKIFLIVHPSNPVRRLTDEQAANLLTGKIANWMEVGGPDQLVEIVTTPPANGTRIMLENQLLKGQKPRSDAQVVANTLQVRSIVSQSPRALGFIGAALVTERVATVETSTPVSADAALVVKGAPSPTVQRLAEAIKPYVK
jgi:phosphate transport system substrate-binding protein